LIYDAVHLFAQALNDLDHSQVRTSAIILSWDPVIVNWQPVTISWEPITDMVVLRWEPVLGHSQVPGHWVPCTSKWGVIYLCSLVSVFNGTRCCPKTGTNIRSRNCPSPCGSESCVNYFLLWKQPFFSYYWRLKNGLYIEKHITTALPRLHCFLMLWQDFVPLLVDAMATSPWFRPWFWM
jgi:hypothetical protein